MSTHTEKEIKQLQRAFNKFNKKYNLRLGELIVDGDRGKLTRARIRDAKFFLGYLRKNIDGDFNDEVLWRLEHPRSTNEKWNVTKAGIERGKKRRSKRRRNVAANHVSSIRPGVGRFDGVPVAREFIPRLQWARDNGWQGKLVSGWRDPRYSETLCYRMCGRPSCPGRCAGRSSRHSQVTLLGGAVDVSDYTRFGQLMQRYPHGTRIVNHLGAADPVHYSVAGN